MNSFYILVSSILCLLYGIGTWTYLFLTDHNFFPGVLPVFAVCFGLILLDIYRRAPAPSHTMSTMLAQYLLTIFSYVVGTILQWRFNRLSRNCKKQQENFLKDVLKTNRNTLIAKDFKLTCVQTVEEFRQTMPLTVYKDYEKYVSIIEEYGTADIMVPGKVQIMALTSGTTSGKSKRYPKSPKAIKTNYLVWFLLLAKKISDCIPMSYLYKLFAPKVVPKLGKTKSDITYGPISVILNTVTPGFVICNKNTISTEKEAYYVHLVHALYEEHISSLQCPVAPNVLMMCKVLENNWQSICDDIENGYLTEHLNISEEERNVLNKGIYKNPERAAWLRREFKRGFVDIIPRLWPTCPCVFALSTGAFQTQASILKERYLGKLPLYSMIHVGTETLYGMNLSPTERDVSFTAMTPINFFEFIPEEEIDKETPSTVLAHQVDEGKIYEVVITTYDGLYRYRTEDTVQITGFYGTVPKYRFVRRAGDILSINLEKVPESLLFASVNAVADMWEGKSVVNFVSVENFYVEKLMGEFSGDSYYMVFIELGENALLNEGDSELVDVELCKRHTVYEAMRSNNKLKPVTLVQVQPGTFEDLKQKMLSSNPNAFCMQFKVPRIIRKDNLLEFLIGKRL